MTTPPNLTKLNFIDIKQSLTDFLKNQSIFVGYNFEGSVIQTLIDLLSYNTYYYAFYSNMMSSELFLDSVTRIESLVSLVKPLGYTVPGRKSSSTTLKLSSTSPIIMPRYSLFIAADDSGSYYNFYNTDIISSSEEVDVLVTEAYELVSEKDITSLFDFTKQKFILDEENVDISTIRIEVKLSTDSDYVEWTNVNFFPNNEGTIFYIERMGKIFTIELGKYNNLGKSLTEGDSIRISYLLSSGSAANDLFQFSQATVDVAQVYALTSGGNNGPDFDTIKFAAPKVFSAQERAVTKQDYVALLIKNNYISNINKVAIYGGDEIYPPKYGRVFISFLDTIFNKSEILSYLRDKNMLTVLPEYTFPISAQLSVVASTTFRSISNSQKESILNKINNDFITEYSDYSQDYGFNLSLNSSTLTSSILDKYGASGLSSISVDYIEYNFTINDTNTSEISFNYPIIRDETQPVYICEPFYTVDEYENIQMIIKLPTPIPNRNNTYIPLEAYEISDNGEYIYRVDIDVGSINYEQGHILFNKIYREDSLNIKIKSFNTNITKLIAVAAKINLILK
jgi:hypothetical protein